MRPARPIGGAAVAAALGFGAPAGAGDGPVALFAAACLDHLPHFAGSPAAFEAAGWVEGAAEPGGEGRPPLRRFGARGAGAVQSAILMPRGPVSTCTIAAAEARATPDGPALHALDAEIAARAGGAQPELSCRGDTAARRCLWIWERAGGCNAVVAASTEGVLRTLMATGIDTTKSCAEAVR